MKIELEEFGEATCLADYTNAPSFGPLHSTWLDKPHRVVYDLAGTMRVLVEGYILILETLIPLAGRDEFKGLEHWSNLGEGLRVMKEFLNKKGEVDE